MSQPNVVEAKTKVCTKCKVRKPLSKFISDKRRLSGHGARCLKCHAKITLPKWHKWHAKNRERHNAAARARAHGIPYEKTRPPITGENNPNFIHGYEGTSIFSRWMTMKSRCYNKNSPKYHRYGGRGIRVCRRWHKFTNFLSDMGPVPTGGNYSLDRIDNDGDYSPSNCRWATLAEQCRNRVTNVFLTFRGQTLCRADWEKKFNLPKSCIRDRMRSGWSLERTLTTPVQKRPQKEEG